MVDESKVDKLTETAAALTHRAELLTKATAASIVQQAQRWKRTAIVEGIAIVVLLAGIGVLIVIALDTSRTADANAEILEDVDRLVDFVDRVEADQTDGPSAETREMFEAVHEMRNAICANPDFTCPPEP